AGWKEASAAGRRPGWNAFWCAGRGTAGLLACRRCLSFVEYWDALQRMELLPRNALGVGYPILGAACVAAGGLADVEQRHPSGLCLTLHHRQVVGVVGLDSQVVNARV